MEESQCRAAERNAAANNYAAFQLAVQKGGCEVSEMAESLWKKASAEQQKEMWITIDTVGAFQQTIKSGDYKMVESLNTEKHENQ
jgi:hypothetical protein